MKTQEEKFVQLAKEKEAKTLAWAKKGRRKEWSERSGKFVTKPLPNPELTSQRYQNLKNAFPEVDWDLSSAICVNYGSYGDRPQYTVKGGWKNFTFYYTYKGPSGANSNLKMFNLKGDKIYHKNPAPFIKAKEIWKHILQVVLN